MANTMRSPKRSTNFPEINPDENRAMANIETMSPTAELFTPKDLANSGIAGMMMPNPSATKNDADTRTLTSRGNPARSRVEINQLPRQLLHHELLRSHGKYATGPREVREPK